MATILIVEDSKHQRLLLAEELECEGYEVCSAGTGRDALHLAATARPDLVVLDIGVPDMDGIELLGRLLARNSRLPIVIYTGYEGYRDSFLSWAAAAYVVKKSDLGELRTVLRQVLRASGVALPTPPPAPVPWTNQAAGQELCCVPRA